MHKHLFYFRLPVVGGYQTLKENNSPQPDVASNYLNQSARHRKKFFIPEIGLRGQLASETDLAIYQQQSGSIWSWNPDSMPIYVRI
jgi:hypothetical protein